MRDAKCARFYRRGRADRCGAEPHGAEVCDEILKEYLWCGRSTRDKTSEYVERIFELVRPERRYFVHFHGDKKFHAHGCDFHLCYDEILKFED